MRECGWEFEDVSLESDISKLIVAQLNLLSENLDAYFSEDDDKRLEENSRIMHPFIDKPTEEELLKLRLDLNQKFSFREIDYSMFWIYLLKFSEYEKLAQKAIAILIQMPTTYLCKESFSNLVKIKPKKRNSVHDIDSLMRGAIEKEINPRYLQIAESMQQQSSH